MDRKQEMPFVKENIVGRDSVVGIATSYELEGPGIESADPSARAV
jgi:hypothetical protein